MSAAMMGRPSAWVEGQIRRTSPACQLICFPHAGGSAVMYRTWSEHLSDEFEVMAIQYPGRGRRMAEPLLKDLHEMVDAAFNGLRPLMRSRIALFGHSMGALIAFEFARRLQADGITPMLLAVAGARAPHLRSVDVVTSHWPHEQFVEHLKSINGTPAEILTDEEALDLVLPIVRADFQLVESYRMRSPGSVRCPIISFGGTGDEKVSFQDLASWAEHTELGCEVILLEGDHFFVHHQEAELTRRISKARGLWP